MHIRIGQLNLAVYTMQAATQQFNEWANDTTIRYVSTCVAYNFVLAHENPVIMRAMQGADAIVADGMPLVWIQRWSGFEQAERIYGPDILLEVCQATQDQPIRHFFYGGNPGVAEKLVEHLCYRFPDLKIAGILAPTGLPTSEIAPDSQQIEIINQSNADVIWVGLGAPRQDIWMAAYQPYLQAHLMIGVGAAFDFLSGTKPQAPEWMQTHGLEWLFRFVSEPGRLWRRYLYYNPRFMWMIGRWAVSTMFKRNRLQ